MKYQGFVGPSYVSRSVNFDCQRTINLYPEVDETGRGKEAEVMALMPTPGLELFEDLGEGPIRCVYAASNRELFVVSKNKLYQIASDGTPTERGTLTTQAGFVSIADNGFELAIVDGTVHGFKFVFETDVFSAIDFPDDIGGLPFVGTDQVVFQDGYFIFNQKGTGQFFISSLNGTTIDPEEFTPSEGNPDLVVGIISNHLDLWIFNENTIEVFFNSGAADFPFERTQGAFIEHGCAAPFSIQKMNNTVFWLGQDDKGSCVIYMANGFQPQRVSTHAIEYKISKLDSVSDAIAYTYQEDGHFFYAINFSGLNTTFVFDSSTGMWHERVYLNDGEFERHRVNFHAFIFNKHIVGDYENGKLYEARSDFYSDNGTAIVRQRIAPHVSSGLNRIFYNELQLDIESGTGLDGVGQGTDPKIMMQFSDDSGRTWSNEKWVDLGAIGETKKRAIWRRLGQSRDRVFKVSVSDPVKVVFLGAELQIEVEAS